MALTGKAPVRSSPSSFKIGRADRSGRGFAKRLRPRLVRGGVVSDDDPGLKWAIPEILSGIFTQRCYVHFLRNALDYVPRNVDDDCLLELRWTYDRRDVAEVSRFRQVASPGAAANTLSLLTEGRRTPR
ncbi:hypothetical protein FXB38_42500 [Bradyrhizobium cytisi]|uniref:Mutator family transposase n=1 Tax=Bradyrhizobium cytisi TaxID=515489 RepID=A0A5S4VSE2_9BRAD|nr:hypothetical protein FXB38_42500 [Bradyrhizobium cytisi]